MKKILHILIAITAFSFCFNNTINAQVGGVAINASGTVPDSSSILDVSSFTKGLLCPRMTTLQRNNIAHPATGLTIFNTDCEVYNYNAGTPASPNWATISASNVLTAGVTISANPVGAICAGASVTFTATPTGGINSPSYQWKVNNSNVGTNSSTYTTTSLNSGDVVTCVLTTSEACVTGSPATSNPITVLVNLVPTITGTAPAGFCSGSAVTLSASANIGTINWYSNPTGGSSLSSGASFTVSGLTDTTTYYVDATANGCTTASRTAVTATFFPNVPGQPGAITGPTYIKDGDTATYSIAALPNTSNYIWAVASGVIASGQGTTSIFVTWPDSAVGNVSVAANNPCASSLAQSEIIYVGTQTFNNTDSLYMGFVQTFNVPAGVTSITITAFGAQGGSGNGGNGSVANGCNCSLPGGKGAEIIGTFAVTPADVIKVLVGQAGGGYGGAHGNENGGGGGSFIVNQTTNTLLIAAGGGGGGPSTAYGTNCSRTPSDGDGQAGPSGATPSCPQCGCSGAGGNNGGGGSTGGSYEGGGGGGYNGDGANGGSHCSTAYGGLSYINGGTGGKGNTCYDVTGIQNSGGFGGGGGGMLGGPGAGGGYSGGGTLGNWTPYSSWGGGGGSYNSGSNQTGISGIKTGQGQVTITW